MVVCDYCAKEIDRVAFCCASCKVMYYRKLGRHLPIAGQMRWEVFKRDNFTCKYCGTKDHLEIDHIIPQRNGGKTEMSNLQTLCSTCNKKKGVSIPAEITTTPMGAIPMKEPLTELEKKLIKQGKLKRRI